MWAPWTSVFFLRGVAGKCVGLCGSQGKISPHFPQCYRNYAGAGSVNFFELTRPVGDTLRPESFLHFYVHDAPMDEISSLPFADELYHRCKSAA